ncbi:MAG: CHAT domain-containing protein [Bacteroides sp.]|nr:CHAT domain-containing protein [Bacteroides sp.]MBD5348073.1 CHAT domain-containing protein [Bacteroides sp.]
MANFSTLILPDGGLYIGELNDDGLPESQEASCAWDNGQSYIGAWANGSMCGVGTLYDRGEIVKYGYWWKGELLHDFSMPTNEELPYGNNQPIPPEYPESQPITAHKITALVIGNNDYPTSPLNNCIKDAEAIAKQLRAMKVDVTILKNATKSQMIDAIQALELKARVYDHVFFYFSGHGHSNQGRHYITSIDESTSDKNPLCLEEIDEFLSGTDYKNIILASDACSVIVNGEGNPEMVKSAGRTLMAFSSSLGAVAYDGIPTEHSPFAFGLLQYISKPISVVQMFQETNKFAMSYAIDHSFYQQPILIISPYFPIDFKLISI